MREICIDTETTGLSPAEGHRAVELGAVEIENSIPTGRTWRSLFNPQRSVSRNASKIHGLTLSKLRNAPLFKERVAGLLAFLGPDSRLIAHNAPFDAAFLDAELVLCGLPRIEAARWFCTLALARRKRPGKRNTLDALCGEFGVSTAHREKHGALKDALLLAEVYPRLADRAQAALDLTLGPVEAAPGNFALLVRSCPLTPRLTPEEAAAHAAFVVDLGPGALWRLYDNESLDTGEGRARTGRAREGEAVPFLSARRTQGDQAGLLAARAAAGSA